jgi:hypothetical protein
VSYKLSYEYGQVTKLSPNCSACGKPMPPLEDANAELFNKVTGERVHPICERMYNLGIRNGEL